jgi:hypothetical protein
LPHSGTRRQTLHALLAEPPSHNGQHRNQD